MTQSNHDKGAEGNLPPISSPWLQSYYREVLENARKLLPEAARQLKAVGVVFVHIDYDGCGDSGQIETISYLDANRQSVDPAGRVTLAEDELKDLFYDLIQARHGGWENDDGGFGEFDWNLDADTLVHTHNDRFTEYDTTEHQGL